MSAGFEIWKVVLIREGGMVGNGWLGLGIWRVLLYGEGGMVGWLIKSAGGVWQNHPPGTE